MGVWAKVLAAIVLLGSAFGVLSTVLGLVTMARQGILDQMTGGSGVIILGQMGLGVFFSVCGIALAVMAPAAPARSA